MGMRKERERKRKTKEVKKVRAEVFIPSTVSVGQLARLLNVRMGASFLCSILRYEWY